MKAFAALYQRLDRSTATQDKRAALVDYFRHAAAHDAAWALYLLSGGKVVQQVPCPILEKNAREDYRIRVSPGLYHKPGERDVLTQGYEWGWAMCIDPRFAYNTESVVDFTGSAGGCAAGEMTVFVW